MRIAISAENNNGLESPVADHFGRCPFFILIDEENGEVRGVNGVSNPHYGSHTPGMVPAFIQKQGVNVMLAGGMGWRANSVFEEMGINVATGASGTVGQAYRQYGEGRLKGFSPCAESEAHRDCQERKEIGS